MALHNIIHYTARMRDRTQIHWMDGNLGFTLMISTVINKFSLWWPKPPFYS